MFDARRKLAQTEPGYSREHWQAFADLGLLALTLPEAHGGLGGNAIDTMVAMEALAPALVLEPYLATAVICGGLIADAGSEAQKDGCCPRSAPASCSSPSRITSRARATS